MNNIYSSGKKIKVLNGFKVTTIGSIPIEWEVLELEEVLSSTFSGGTPSRGKNHYFEGGTIPWIKSGEINQVNIYETEEYITEEGLINSSAKIVETGTLLYAMYGATAGIAGYSRIRAAINQAILAIIPNQKAEIEYLFHYLNFRKSTILNTFTQGAQPNLSASIIKSLIIPLPTIDEQLKIINILNTWDQAIEKTQSIIEKLTIRNKGLAQLLLTGRKRVGNYTTPWEEKTLGNYTKNMNIRNLGTYDMERLYGVSKIAGLVPMREQVMGTNFDGCKIVRSQWFAYNPMRINIGSIAFWKGEDEIMVSGDYVVFACNESRLLPQYLDQVRKTNLWENFMMGAGNGSVRIRIYFKDLAHMKLTMPSVDEQKAILKILIEAQKELALNEKKLTSLKIQKRGLMQKLLTGQIRTS